MISRGSNPPRSTLIYIGNSMGECLFYMQDVIGSSPIRCTKTNLPMVELVFTTGLKPVGHCDHVGSTPTRKTKYTPEYFNGRMLLSKSSDESSNLSLGANILLGD
jgi:hypothetical protein